MNLKRKPSLVQFLAGASVAAMGASAPLAMAQDATAGDETSDEISQDEGDVIIVSGIRASLQDAMNIKRNAVGVVDAIIPETPDAADEPVEFSKRVGAAIAHELFVLAEESDTDRQSSRIARYRNLGVPQ